MRSMLPLAGMGFTKLKRKSKLRFVRRDSKYSQVTLPDTMPPAVKAEKERNVPVSIIIPERTLRVVNVDWKSEAKDGFVMPLK